MGYFSSTKHKIRSYPVDSQLMSTVKVSYMHLYLYLPQLWKYEYTSYLIFKIQGGVSFVSYVRYFLKVSSPILLWGVGTSYGGSHRCIPWIRDAVRLPKWRGIRVGESASTFFCVTTDDEINGTGRKAFALRGPTERPPNSWNARMHLLKH